MKIRRIGTTEDKIELQMTPMIDIVFQLLVFFIMTFKIVAQEGDFNIKMPLQQQQQGPTVDSPVLTLHVQLRAAPNGDLLSPGGIIVNGDLRFDSCDQLHNYIIGILGGDEPMGRDDAEVELDFDYGLNYENVIDAISAVSGYVDESTGQVKRLIEQIKFTPHLPYANNRPALFSEVVNRGALGSASVGHPHELRLRHTECAYYGLLRHTECAYYGLLRHTECAYYGRLRHTVWL